jgi:hypothetical protein
MKKPMANNHIYLLHAFGFFLEICRDGISLREKGGHFSFLFFSRLGSARLGSARVDALIVHSTSLLF